VDMIGTFCLVIGHLLPFSHTAVHFNMLSIHLRRIICPTKQVYPSSREIFEYHRVTSDGSHLFVQWSNLEIFFFSSFVLQEKFEDTKGVIRSRNYDFFCLFFFFELRLLITPLVSSNFSFVRSSNYDFKNDRNTMDNRYQRGNQKS
jgi:hypothetical protein